jgi:hypothetical protein
LLKTQLLVELLRPDVPVGRIRVQIAVLLAQQKLNQALQERRSHALALTLFDDTDPGQVDRVVGVSVGKRVQVSYVRSTDYFDVLQEFEPLRTRSGTTAEVQLGALYWNGTHHVQHVIDVFVLDLKAGCLQELINVRLAAV